MPSFLLNDPDFDGIAPELVTVFGQPIQDDQMPFNGAFSVPQSAQPSDTGSTQSPMQRRVARSLFKEPAAPIISADLTSLRTGVAHRAMRKAPITYAQRPAKSIELDGLLYNVLKMIVKGTKCALLMHVRFPSYVQGVCILINHIDISKYDRITKSIFAMDKLVFQGDVHKFQVQAMEAIRELRSSKANMTHLILTRLMKAFDGKSKTVQYRIAEIINSGVEIDETLNLFDIIQSLCSDIATVGDVKAVVNSITDEDKCDFCGYRHRTSDCRKLIQAKQDVKDGKIRRQPRHLEVLVTIAVREATR